MQGKHTDAVATERVGFIIITHNHQTKQDGSTHVKRLIAFLILAAVPVLLTAVDWIEILRVHAAPGDLPARIDGQGERAGMVLVSAGSFVMGGNDNPDQMPIRRRWLPVFWIDCMEVTAAEFDAFLRQQDAPPPGPPLWTEAGLRPELGEHPAYPVTWEQADAYCRARGKRLPTEAEWEKAARGPGGLAYPWGDGFDTNRVNDRAATVGLPVKSQPVGAFPEGGSVYGALDMAGNIREWVADPYEPDAYKEHRFTLPVPWIDRLHVLRGGSFMSSPDKLTTFNRSHSDLDATNADQGFRCAAGR